MRSTGLSWRRGFDAWERLVGGRLEELVLTRTFNDLLALTLRTECLARGLLDHQTSAVLHLWNIPTRADVGKLRRQVGGLTADLQELSLRLERDWRHHQVAGLRDGDGAIDRRGPHAPQS